MLRISSLAVIRAMVIPVSKRTSIAGVLGFLVLLPILTIGCNSEGRLPTAVTVPANNVAVASQNLAADDETAAEKKRGRDHELWPHRKVIIEAKESLGALLTGEQVYYQRFATYTDVADTADIRATLGVSLGEPSRRWAFSVSGASVTGFVATARGRAHTRAAGIIVTLRHVRGQPLEWRVQRRRT